MRLPSGGWWDLLARPRWSDLRLWHEDGADLAERALIALSSGWSFPEPIDTASLSARSPEDLAEALLVLKDQVVAPLERQDPKQMAEALFAGLVAGHVPVEFVEAHLMAATGWSWATLQETPADVVQRLAVYLTVRLARDTGAGLDFVSGDDSSEGGKADEEVANDG